MNAITEILPKKITVSGLAQDCMRRAKGDRDLAVKIMVELVEKNESLFRQLMAPLVKSACRTAISGVIHGERSDIWNSKSAPEAANVSASVSERQKARINALAKGTLEGFLAWPLRTGKLLGAATREEVSAEATEFHASAKQMKHRGDWLTLIVDRLEPGQIVGDVLTSDDLRKMQEAAGAEL